MNYSKLDEFEQERYGLARGRLEELAREQAGFSAGEKRIPSAEAWDEFFSKEAAFLLQMERIREQLWENEQEELPGLAFMEQESPEKLASDNRALYEELLPESYGSCFGNPDYAKELFGDCSDAIGFIYTELRGAVVFAYENRPWDLLILCELLLECLSVCMSTAEESAGADQAAEQTMAAGLENVIRWYVRDYTKRFMEDRVRESVDPSCGFARDLILSADLSVPNYLYRYGEYITENERTLCRYLAGLPQEEIDAAARTWTEGYRKGFEVTGKDISIKKTVNIRYRLGFERIVASAVRQFREMGLESIIYRSAAHAVNRPSHYRIGFYGAVPNRQFEYDHRNDSALYLDEHFVSGRLRALQEAYEKYRDCAAVHGGPAVMDVFGETPFSPETKRSAPELTEQQKAQAARYQTEAGRITNRYIKGEERSFTIIAYPVPEIGPAFGDIFRETIRINNLDYDKYRTIQQKLIDVLDTGVSVRVRGMNGNHTDISVALHPLGDPARQTCFENCVADVNIPVGEVFTSPRLEGTNGILHVKNVHLEGFRYQDLEFTIRDGFVKDYGCGNFDDPEEGRALIEENILYHHAELPVGEFAIGTNTAAYRMGQVYGIAALLPILIAEKTGPHFAFGDTCYSFQEDVAVYNPDGKEIIARDNECSIRRKSDPASAYFGCHTDVTIPYEELGSIAAVREDGSEVFLLENGRFVLPGTEELNEPLEGLF